MHRRELLTGLAALMGCSVVSLGPTSARANPSKKKLIFVILRGGMDGLAAVAPVGDPAYASARQAMALDASRLLPLSGPFALHPAFSSIHSWYKEGTLSFVQAAGLAYQKRSHFDAQDVLENGSTRPGHFHTGWLNRALRDRPNAQGLAVGHRIPLVLRGAESVSTVDLLRTKDARLGLLDFVEELWEQDPHLSTALHQGLLGRDRVRAAQGDTDLTSLKKKNRVKQSLSILGAMLSEPEAPQVAVLEFGGWDTHANQGGISGGLAAKFKQLSEGLAALKKGLGPTWNDTVVVTCSEFGRTVASNGTKGTDHGSGGLVMLAGGGVRGGAVHGDWPGLQRSALHQGRDLRTTTDMRSVFKSVLHEHLEVSMTTLNTHVFPDSRAAPLLPRLFHSS